MQTICRVTRTCTRTTSAVQNCVRVKGKGPRGLLKGRLLVGAGRSQVTTLAILLVCIYLTLFNDQRIISRPNHVHSDRVVDYLRRYENQVMSYVGSYERTYEMYIAAFHYEDCPSYRNCAAVLIKAEIPSNIYNLLKWLSDQRCLRSEEAQCNLTSRGPILRGEHGKVARRTSILISSAQPRSTYGLTLRTKRAVTVIQIITDI